MKEINDEIKLTIEMMQNDTHEGALNELQSHLYSLLEIKRNELQKPLTERSWAEFDSVRIEVVALDPNLVSGLIQWAKPLTAEELKAGGWWCADVSEECRLAFAEKGLEARSADWSLEDGYNWLNKDVYQHCYSFGDTIIRSRLQTPTPEAKQIHRIGNNFYWSEE